MVIFCLLFSFVDYVPVKGEIIWGEKMQTIVTELKNKNKFKKIKLS